MIYNYCKYWREHDNGISVPGCIEWCNLVLKKTSCGGLKEQCRYPEVLKAEEEEEK